MANQCEEESKQLHVQAQLSVLDELSLPNPFQVITELDVDEANHENTVDPDDDVDIEYRTMNLLFLQH